MEFRQTPMALNEELLEGELTSKHQLSQEEIISTLDEPISVTIKRDLNSVWEKLKYVIFPRSGNALLKDWDLWGPLALCLVLSVLLQSSDSSIDESHGTGPEFAQVFVSFWIGAIVVTLNSQLLGGSLSFFQTVCVLGYSILPLVASLIICRIVLMINQTLATFIIRLLIVFGGLAYSTFSSLMFLMPSQKPHRTALAVYPVCLFYFFLAWLVISV